MLSRPTWAILAPLWTVLLCGLSFQAAYAQGPTLSYSLERQRATAGVPFQVAYEVRWRGPADAYALVPSEPEQVPWGSARLVESTATSDEGEHVVRYMVEFIAEKPGTVEVPPYLLSYYGSEAFSRSNGETDEAAQPREPKPERSTLRTPAFDVEVQRQFRIVVLVVAALAAGLLAIVGIVLFRRRAARPQSAHTGGAAAQTAQAALNMARQYRLDGKLYEYYRELARGATLLAPSVAARKLREKLEQDAERVGYGALQPSEDDLEGAARDLERAMREQARDQN